MFPALRACGATQPQHYFVDSEIELEFCSVKLCYSLSVVMSGPDRLYRQVLFGQLVNTRLVLAVLTSWQP